MIESAKLTNLTKYTKVIEVLIPDFTNKSHPPSADLRSVKKDSVTPSTLIFAAIESKLMI